MELIRTPSKFYGLKNAREFIAHCIQPGKWSIVIGDDGTYWVVSNREAGALARRGYVLVDVREKA